MELGVFVSDPAKGTGLVTELSEAIPQGFHAAGIAVPYPQRDRRLRQDTEAMQNPAKSMG